jgi:ribose transport system substrate-binding protein
MKRPNVLLSLATADDDFQVEQAEAAKQAARQLNADVQVLYADSDAIYQGEQLLEVIQARGAHPDGIIVQPASGTGLPQIARSAAASGISWIVLNRQADYIAEFRSRYHVPICSVSADQAAIGRIQGQQLTALLPEGGRVLYIQGPITNPAAREQTFGMSETKPANLAIKIIKAPNWTSMAGYRAISSWLRLPNSHRESIDLIAAQGEALIMGAQKALHERSGAEWAKWSQVPLIGVDGLPHGGQKWVRDGLLAATVVVPPNAGVALELLVKAMQTGMQPPENTFMVPTSYPPIEALTVAQAGKSKNSMVLQD